MPYIDSYRRKELDAGYDPHTPGELNYWITREILAYLESKKTTDVNCYADYNEVMGVLACVQQELYRRRIAIYEDLKKDEQGDVF